MKFTCEKYALDNAVTIAARAVSPKPGMDILSGLLIEASVSVCLTGYDMKKGICTHFDADVSEQGSIVLNTKLFGEIVRKLPDGVVTLKSDNNNMVNIACGNADYNIMGSDAEDFPELPTVDASAAIVVKQSVFASMISETAFAISDNESRPVYTGALVDMEDGGLTMVACDGYRVALRREKAEESDVQNAHFIVPGSALSDVEKICTEEDKDVRITVGSKHINFAVNDTVLVTRRLEGEFLNYKKTMPTEFVSSVTAKRSELIRCVERVSLIIDDRVKNPLRCCFKDGELNISCATAQGRAEDICAVSGSGNDMIIGFNNSYLLQCLKAAPSDELAIRLINPNSPCVFAPVDDSDRFLYLILPVRLRA